MYDLGELATQDLVSSPIHRVESHDRTIGLPVYLVYRSRVRAKWRLERNSASVPTARRSDDYPP